MLEIALRGREKIPALMSAVEDFLRLQEPGVSLLEFTRNATPYVGARSLVNGHRVVDVGCGPGYGSFLTALGTPRSILTCDVDEVRLPPDPTSLVQSSLTDACRLALRSNAFDVALMFEVIEHVTRPEEALGELKRVLAPAGVAVLSTPNRRVRLMPFEPPINDEHLREWTPRAFASLLKRTFPAAVLLGVYGEPPFQERVLADWKPSLLRLYRRYVRSAIARVLSERGVQRVVGAARHARVLPRATDGGGHGGAMTNDVPELVDLTGETWPFFIAERTGSCLSVVAVCGEDGDVVEDLAAKVISAFGARDST